MKQHLSVQSVLALGVCLVLLVFSLLSCNNADGAIPDGMKLASGELNDFTLYIPEAWTADLYSGSVGVRYSTEDPSSVTVSSWELEDASMTVEQWTEMSKNEAVTSFADVETTDAENLTIDGNYAQSYTYTGIIGSSECRVLQVATVKNGKIYQLTYVSTPETYESHIDDVNAMVANMKLGK